MGKIILITFAVAFVLFMVAVVVANRVDDKFDYKREDYDESMF